MHISNLIIEVTRRCNLSCIHCLRGDAEDKDLQPEVLDKLLSQVDSIGILTLTGGEPFLKPKIIQNIANKLMSRRIGSFYIATNGTCFTPGCLKAVADLYYWADEKEECQVDFSNDYFHESELSGTTKEADSKNLLALLAITGNKNRSRDSEVNDNPDEKFKYLRYEDSVGYGSNSGSNIIYRGNATRNLSPSNCKVIGNPWNKEDLCEGSLDRDTDICISVDGKVGINCDYNYDWMDENYVCEVAGLTDFINKYFEDDDF